MFNKNKIILLIITLLIVLFNSLIKILLNIKLIKNEKFTSDKIYDLNFLASAKGDKYEVFLIPFIFFSILSNKNSHVEIIVDDPKKFKLKYEKELDFLHKLKLENGLNYLIRKHQYEEKKNLYEKFI